jgi:ubiquitin thioesterase protein OTUB1
MFSRFLTSAYLRSNSDRFEGFQEGYFTLMEFIRAEVDPMNRESDQLQVMALTEALGVKVVIEYLDASGTETCSQLTFPVEYSGPAFEVRLLYRPGHYDVLYSIPR